MPKPSEERLTTTTKTATPAELERAYMARELIAATLPHRDPGDMPSWSRRNGGLTLMLQPGLDKDTGQSTGFPYGSIPRLLLFWITSEAVRTRSNRLELGKSLNAFLLAVGLSPSTGGGKRGDAARLKEQMKRLLSCRISFVYAEGDATRGRKSSRDMLITTAQSTWWGIQEPDDDYMVESVVLLSDDFFNAITAAPVPLDMNALKALKGSPLRLDLYGWVTWRIWTLQQAGQAQVDIPIAVLVEQFGSEYNRIANFRTALKEALEAVHEVFPALDYTLMPRKLIIRSGKVPISKVTEAKQLRQIEKPNPDKVTMLTKGKFTTAYPDHDLKACLKDFREWVSKSEVEARDIDKLFLSFAKKWVNGRES